MEELDDLFDVSQYYTLDGTMMIPNITPESGTDGDDFYQSSQESPSSLQCSNTELKSENLYGHEFLGFDRIRDRPNGEGNLPSQVMEHKNESNHHLFSSWKALNTATNPIPQPQIDPNTGLPRKICSNCGSISTPSWRRCPEGRNLLCNACGLYQKLHNRPRPLRIREDGSVQVIRSSTSMNRNVCQNCKTTDTPIWRRSQGDRNFLLCNACALYLKNHNSDRPKSINYNDDE